MTAPSPLVSVSGPVDGEFRWTLAIGDLSHPKAVGEELAGHLATVGDDSVNLWIEDLDPSTAAPDDADDFAAGFGFVAYRDLWQLRAPLPVGQSTELVTRPIEPRDYDAVLDVNRRAFAWHPEQGAMSAEDFAARRAEDWYDPNGFLVHEHDGRVAGFHWTKPHRHLDPPVGEIYVIGVDPDVHGLGIGRGLAIAGLEYLHSRAFDVAMLYVESDNDTANKLYFDLGFELHRLNRAYRRATTTENGAA